VAIKGEAYGVGLSPAARTFWAAGCRDYFVARPVEGRQLRRILPEANIYVLDGLHGGQAKFYVRHNLIPCLISLDEVRDWARDGRKQPCTLHVDSGINRMGLSEAEFDTLLADKALLKRLNIALLMSHLASSDDPAAAMNERQLTRFREIRKKLPQVPASLANSSGIFLGKSYHFDLVRPGVALYGGNPVAPKRNPMKAVATLEAVVRQVRTVPKGETVGYSTTWKAPRDSRIALAGAGYRDGVPRKLSSSKVDGPAQVFIAGKRCPIVGRVSMDMLAIDVTSLAAGKVKPGDRAELFGPHISVDEAAAWAGTISYELLTHLGPRYARVYRGK
jgi:alanine racemase